MATKKSSKKTATKSSAKPKATTVKSEKTKSPEPKTKVVTAKTNPFAGFFAPKYDSGENVLTIFKTPKIWGALLGELVGIMLFSFILLTIGLSQPLFIMFGIIAVTMAVYAFSGAHLNPLVTVGMMATRRISAIRGVLYIVAQVIGAWLGLVLVNAFRIAGGGSAKLPTMAALESKTVWACIFIELIGAIIIGYFFCRAQAYRTARGAFTYAAIIGGGLLMAVLFGLVVSGSYLSLRNNFIMNPALAIMYQIFPKSAADFGELIGNVALAGMTYLIVPAIGGVLGFFLSDASSKLAGEE